RSRTSSPPEMPPVVARKLMASRSQQSSAKATRTLAIVAADLEAIGTPAPITFIDRDAAVMPAHGTTGMAIEQKAMDLHHPVDPLVVRGLQTRGQRLALEDGVNAPVAVGRQFGDRRLDLSHECLVR